MKYSLFGKYTFLPYEKLLPFVSIGMSYARGSHTFQPYPYSDTTTMTYDNKKGEFGADVNLGVNYALSRSFHVGVSVGTNAHVFRKYLKPTISSALGATLLY